MAQSGADIEYGPYKGSELKSAHVWYKRLRRDSPTLSRTVPFAPEASPSTVPMW